RGTGRNLFGQLDGTVNPTPGTADFDGVVWIEDGPAAGGTSMVIRRIHMDLEGWDLLGRAARENSVGRTLDTGAPFTGSGEFDEPDLRATDSLGFPVIPAESHMRRARSDNPDERIFRRPYNYDEAPTGDEVSNSGQIFVSFQADVEAQFVPIQRRLDELDILNEWTTPIGSSVLLVPPGCTEGGYVGETLLG
ncbi:MAG: Dyp-type peroxidase, partial [Actinomycetaceae bacterium]